MVQNLTLTIANIHRSSMSINSSIGSIDSPTSSIESDAITFQDVPLSALSKGSRKKLSHLLNSKKILRSEEGYERDWRGLAFLAKQKSLCDESSISGDDPMTKVIQLWSVNNPNTATFAYLEKFLGIIDRWDVCDDIFENLVEDTKRYQSKQQQNSFIPDSADCSVDIDTDFGHGSDPNILTNDDVTRAEKGLPPQKYDAFVLYADADLNYVTEMLTKLEDSAEHNFKLCIKDRDLLGGVASKYGALTQLIEERCKYLIVILTKAFLRSAENKFLVDFTQAIQIEHKTRKIIPLLYEHIDVPRTLNIYTHLRYNNNSMSFCDFWTKLANSIRNVNMVAEPVAKPIMRREIYSAPAAPNRHSLNISSQALSSLSSPPTEIPSISINGNVLVPSDSVEFPQKEERSKFRAFTMRHNRNKVATEGTMLRNAHSTGQLHTSYQNNATSMSNLSITSESKKKKKWPKLLKKVFTRSSTKLHQQSA